MKVSLSKALKIKNRLVGEIIRLSEIMRRENSRRNDNVSTVVCSDVFQSILNTYDSLVRCKTEIAKANIDIYEKIEKMSELKQFINFLNSIPVREGEEVEFQGMQREKVVYKWTAFLNRQAIDNKMVEIKNQINVLQDEIDLYNAVTLIDI